ncbi:MAG: hypothetical protein ACTHLN_13240 [Tepidisphaeraceae bacterium]
MKPGGRMLGVVLMVLGIAGIVGAFLSTAGHVQRFWFAYLFGLATITAVSCAALIFVLVTHLVRVGWNTNLRRIMETFAVQLPMIFVLALPIAVLVVLPGGKDANGKPLPGPGAMLFSWDKPIDTPFEREPSEALHEAAERGEILPPGTTEALQLNANLAKYPNDQVQPGVNRRWDENIKAKAEFWLNPYVYAIRLVAMFGIMGGIAWYFWKNSVAQDATGDLDISDKLSFMAAPMLAAAGVIVTFIAFDLFQSLDPHWFSTMFGVYYFASGTQAMWALTALFMLVLQSRGYLTLSLGIEHRHDIGKWMWAFIFFFAYITFDQYMLQWYANMPGETFWFDKRGYSTLHPNGYSPLVFFLVFGRFVIPFAGLVSRHVKRSRFGLGFWAAWLLVGFVVDMYLLVIPEYSYTPLLGAPEILGFLGFVCLWFGNVIRTLGNHALRPLRDPRIHESLAVTSF